MEATQKRKSDRIERLWSTEFRGVNLRQITADTEYVTYLSDCPRPALITRSGFEQAHIVTSQIASG